MALAAPGLVGLSEGGGRTPQRVGREERQSVSRVVKRERESSSAERSASVSTPPVKATQRWRADSREEMRGGTEAWRGGRRGSGREGGWEGGMDRGTEGQRDGRRQRGSQRGRGWKGGGGCRTSKVQTSDSKGQGVGKDT